MEYINDLNNLLPEEIEKILNEIKEVLEIVKCRKNTNSRFVNKVKERIVCPHCESNNIIKNGHDKNRVQCYYCKECNKKFTPGTKTIVAHTKLTYEQLTIFFECMNNKLSIKKTAAKMKCNKNTVFLLRHKVLDALSKLRKSLKLKGITEVDETYKSINLKGTKKEKMPRASKQRSSNGGSKRGISNHQVCIASAIDENDNCFLEIVGTGPITSEQVKKVFDNKVKDVNCFITDCKSSYEDFVKRKNIKLEQVKSGTYVNQNGYNLANINSLHSELETFLSCFKGVSTKHLQHYLDWFCFQKFINYTVKIVEQPLTTMKKLITKNSKINSNNVYNNTSGINFDDVYSDYNFTPLTI